MPSDIAVSNDKAPDSIPTRRALGIRYLFALSDPVGGDAIDGILSDLGVTMERISAPSSVTEVLSGDLLVLNASLREPNALWLKGHAIGHRLLHRGNQLRVADPVLVSRQERQAELFAGWLFLAETWNTMEPWQLAEFHHLPQKRIERWLSLVVGDGVVSAGW